MRDLVVDVPRPVASDKCEPIGGLECLLRVLWKVGQAESQGRQRVVQGFGSVVDGHVASGLLVRDVAKPHGVPRDTVVATSTPPNRRELGAVGEHLAHVALATVSVPSLDLASCSSLFCRVWVTPVPKAVLKVFYGHAHEVEAGYAPLGRVLVVSADREYHPVFFVGAFA